MLLGLAVRLGFTVMIDVATICLFEILLQSIHICVLKKVESLLYTLPVFVDSDPVRRSDKKVKKRPYVSAVISQCLIQDRGLER